MAGRGWMAGLAATAFFGGLAAWLMLAPAEMPEPLIDTREWQDLLNEAKQGGALPSTHDAIVIQSSGTTPEASMKNSFATILGEPTSTPTPTPRPPLPPDAWGYLVRHRIDGIAGKTVLLTNTKTKESLMLTVGEYLYGEDRGQSFAIQLKSVDMKTLEATFEYQDEQRSMKLIY